MAKSLNAAGKATGGTGQKLPRDDSRTNAKGLGRYASEFLMVADYADAAISAEMGQKLVSMTPVIFLVAHSLELAFKSYLRHTNFSVADVEKLRHDIFSCYKMCRANGLDTVITLSESDLSLLRLISKLHSSTRLRYIETGHTVAPAKGPMFDLANNIVGPICRHVGAKSHLTKS